jgi:hypothetical protein
MNIDELVDYIYKDDGKKKKQKKKKSPNNGKFISENEYFEKIKEDDICNNENELGFSQNNSYIDNELEIFKKRLQKDSIKCDHHLKIKPRFTDSWLKELMAIN